MYNSMICYASTQQILHLDFVGEVSLKRFCEMSFIYSQEKHLTRKADLNSSEGLKVEIN